MVAGVDSKCFRRLSLEDRIEIQVLLEHGKNYSEIARALGVHRSTVSREVRKRLWVPSSEHANKRYRPRYQLHTRTATGHYLAAKAQQHADLAASNSHRPYLFRNDRLFSAVVSMLMQGCTPQLISGRLKVLYPNDHSMRVSHETIYAWIYSKELKHRMFYEYLPRGRKRRARRGYRRAHRGAIRNRISIKQRPESVHQRAELGHWEADTVLGTRNGSSKVIYTTVERASRRFSAVLLPAGTADNVLKAMLALKASLPNEMVKTITVDNGSEFARHDLYTRITGVPVFFTDPYSAWQKGSVENRNGILRRYLPKRTDFSALTQAELDEIVEEINNRPMKILGYKTPNEVFFSHLKRMSPAHTIRIEPCGEE